MRTQITFETHDEEMFKKIEEEAKKQGLSKASLCRHLLFEKLNEVQKDAGSTNTASSN